MQEIRSRLEAMLDQLTERSARIEADLRLPGNADWKERATEVENDEVLERLGRAELSEIRSIRSAIARIDAGKYGICERCAGPIDARRLLALPFTNVCIDCAE